MGCSCFFKVYLYGINKIILVEELNLLDIKLDIFLIGILLVSEEVYCKDGNL